MGDMMDKRGRVESISTAIRLASVPILSGFLVYNMPALDREKGAYVLLHPSQFFSQFA